MHGSVPYLVSTNKVALVSQNVIRYAVCLCGASLVIDPCIVTVASMR